MTSISGADTTPQVERDTGDSAPTRVFDARFNTYDYDDLKRKTVVASDGERNEIAAKLVRTKWE